MTTQLELPLSELCKAQPGWTSSQATTRVEAARVTMSSHHAKSPTPLSVTANAGAQHVRGMVEWKKPTERMRRGYANIHDRTELGAECISVAVMRVLRGLVVKSRMETGTGADWILGTPDSPDDDFEDDIVLEVSGIDFVRAPSELENRLYEKVGQVKRGHKSGGNLLDGVAIVVGFADESSHDRVGVVLQDVPYEEL